jgi:hypothetical protein
MSGSNSTVAAAGVSANFPAKHTTTNMTIGGWFKFSSLGSFTTVFGFSDSSQGWLLDVTAGAWYPIVNLAGGGNVQGSGLTPPIELNAWTHVAMRITASTGLLEMFVNGVKMPATLSVPNGAIATVTSQQPIILGNQAGLYNEVFAFDRALSDAEIQAICNNGLNPGSLTAWYASETVQPKNVFENGTPYPYGGVSSLTGLAPGNFYWDSAANRVHVITSTGEPPSTMTMEASHRMYGVLLHQGVSHLNFSGLSFVGANVDGLYSFDNSDISLNSITANHNGANGVRTYSPSGFRDDNWTVQNSTFAYNFQTGLLMNGYGSGWLVSNSVFHDNAIDPVQNDYAGGLRFISTGGTTSQEASNSKVTGNTAYNNGVASPAAYGQSIGAGIWFDTVSTGNSMTYNTSYDNNDANFLVEISDGVIVAYNTSYGSRSNGIRLFNHDTNCKVYNNTMYGNAAANLVLLSDANDLGFNNNVVTNNIAFGRGTSLFTNAGGGNDGIKGKGNVYLNNSFGTETANFIIWQGAPVSTYSDWEKAPGNCGTPGCSVSAHTSPTFVLGDVSSPNFALSAGSSGIRAGKYIFGVTPSIHPNIGAH